ncbi:transcriptional regulator, partial [Streptomyces sp. NPDC005407]
GAADLYRAVGKQLKLLRERVGWTQKELGDRLATLSVQDSKSPVDGGRRGSKQCDRRLLATSTIHRG